MPIIFPQRFTTRGPGRLHAGAAFRSLSRPVRVALLLPALALAACEDATGRGPRVSQTCTAPVRLSVGESADLAADAEGRVRCTIQGSANAEYLVAFVDTRAIEKSRTQNEGYGAAFGPYGVSAALAEDVDAAPVMNASARFAAAPRAPDFDVQLAAPPADHGVLRETPWMLDERFSLYDGAPQEPRPARVVRIYGPFVFAWFEGDNEAELPAFLAQLDSAWAGVGGHALPLMRAAYSGQDPVTSPGAGQFLVVLRTQGRGAVPGWTTAIDHFGAPRIWTDLKVRSYGSVALTELLAHELAHAYQAMYMYRTRPAGVDTSYAGAAYWAVEGGADLVSFETLRRAEGVALTANLDILASGGGSPRMQRLRVLSRGSAGQLTEGYAQSAAFLRWQAAQLARAGAGADEAVGEVLRGAADGWHGFDSENAKRTGFTERMRARLGAGWTPEGALLDWTLSHAADDRTDAERFQDPTFLRVWQMPGGSASPWPGAGTLPASLTGMVATTRVYGSPDYITVHAQGDEPFAAASSVPGVRWRILRVR